MRKLMQRQSPGLSQWQGCRNACTFFVLAGRACLFAQKSIVQILISAATSNFCCNDALLLHQSDLKLCPNLIDPIYTACTVGLISQFLVSQLKNVNNSWSKINSLLEISVSAKVLRVIHSSIKGCGINNCLMNMDRVCLSLNTSRELMHFNSPANCYLTGMEITIKYSSMVKQLVLFFFFPLYTKGKIMAYVVFFTLQQWSRLTHPYKILPPIT